MHLDGTQNFTVAGSALRCKANLYNCYELGDLLATANVICFKQETGTLHYKLCTVSIKGQSRLFGCTYNCTTVLRRSDEGLTLETSAFESLYGGQFTLSTQLIKPNHLINCILVQLPKENQTLSGVPEDIHTQHPFMASF